MLKELQENEQIVYIGELFERRNYPRQYFHDWGKEYKECPEIVDTIKMITTILESRINMG